MNNRYCFCPTISGTPGTKAAALNAARWGQFETVTAKFIGGDLHLSAKVEAVAQELFELTNLTLVFQSSGNTDVRIDFVQGDGSWSYLGTQCRNIPQDQATMNYGWLTPASDETEIRSVVLHEFGHALGLIHEHQSPVGGIKWNRAAVIRDLSGPPNNWDLATIDSNMFARESTSDVTGTTVDPLSIMMYQIPSSWTTDGFSSDANDDLSAVDRQFIPTLYPK